MRMTSWTLTTSCHVESGNRIWRVLKYAYYDMLRDIGLRLLIGLVVAALIQVVVPDEFFLSFGSQPLLQMLVILSHRSTHVYLFDG